MRWRFFKFGLNDISRMISFKAVFTFIVSLDLRFYILNEIFGIIIPTELFGLNNTLVI